MLFLSVRSLGMAADVLPRGITRSVRGFRPHARQRVRGLGKNEEGGLAPASRVDPCQLEAVLVSHAVDDIYELQLARHAGPVLNLPAALLALRCIEARPDLRHRRSWRAVRRGSSWL